jgi:hypothetical protein
MTILTTRVCSWSLRTLLGRGCGVRHCSSIDFERKLKIVESSFDFFGLLSCPCAGYIHTVVVGDQKLDE